MRGRVSDAPHHTVSIADLRVNLAVYDPQFHVWTPIISTLGLCVMTQDGELPSGFGPGFVGSTEPFIRSFVEPSCKLQSVLDVSTFLPPSNPRMNSQRKSNVVRDPSVFFTPFGVPSAGDQPAGQDDPTKAITQPVGTTAASFESMVPKSVTILFHSMEESPDPVPTVFTCVRIPQLAYAAQTAKRAIQKDVPMAAP